MENNQIAVIAVVALLLSVIGLGAVAYSYSDSGAQAIGISRRVSTYNIIDDAITNVKMANDSVDSAEYVDGSVDNIHKAENNSYWTVTFDKEGQYTTTTDPIATFQMPFAATLVEVSATALDINTTIGNESYILDLEEAGVSVLNNGTVAIGADNTPAVGTIFDATIADNAKMEILLTLAGPVPTLDDLTISLVFKVAHAAA